MVNKETNDNTISDRRKKTIIESIAYKYYYGTFEKAAKALGTSKSTIVNHFNDFPQFHAEAKELSEAKLTAPLLEIAELACNLQLKKLKDSEAKIAPQVLNMIVGTAYDKLLILKGLNKQKVEHSGKVEHVHKEVAEYIIDLDKAKKQVEELNANSSKNRIKSEA